MEVEAEAVPSVEDDFEMVAKGMMSPAVAIVVEVVMTAVEVEVEVEATFGLAYEVVPDTRPWDSSSDMVDVLNLPVPASVEEMNVTLAVEKPVQTTAFADYLHSQG